MGSTGNYQRFVRFLISVAEMAYCVAAPGVYTFLTPRIDGGSKNGPHNVWYTCPLPGAVSVVEIGTCGPHNGRDEGRARHSLVRCLPCTTYFYIGL